MLVPCSIGCGEYVLERSWAFLSVLEEVHTIVISR